MPHITIEYSANIATYHDIPALVGAVHAAALAHGLPPVDGLRTRAACREHFRIGNADPMHAFIAIHTRIGPGRPSEQKKSFIAALLDAAEATTDAEAGPLAISWSIELNEIDPEFRINRNYVRERMNDTSQGASS